MSKSTTIHQKIANVQKAIGPIAKDSTNPFFKAKYFDINSLLNTLTPLLLKEGLVLTQPILNGSVHSIITEIETGEVESSDLTLPELNDPQKIGSCITYYRRYTLQSLLALEAEDDDANKASGNTPTQNVTEKPWLNILDKQKNMTPEWKNVAAAIADGRLTSISQVREKYKVNKEVEAKINELLSNPKSA